MFNLMSNFSGHFAVMRTLFLFNTLTATAIQRIVLHHYRPQAE